MRKLRISNKVRKYLFVFYYFLPLLWGGLGWGISFSQNYWQQEVNYKINVTLDDNKHFLYGFETIEYTNNSPDTLHYLYFHLWPNAYKDKNTALAKQMFERMDRTKLYTAKEKDRGYIDSLDFKVNGQSVKWQYDASYIDICKVFLNKPLLSGEKVFITTPFRLKIPSAKFSRLGHTGQAYYISQWYPKPAVYDKNGWNQMPYLTIGEFYSEFGSFDVTITLPKDYVVAATGNLMTPEELLWLNKIADSTKKLLTAHPLTPSPREGEQSASGRPFGQDLEGATKKIRYTEKNIHDFAWFADKRFLVLKGEVELPHSKRKVTTWSFFTPSNVDLWNAADGGALKYINDAVYYYSLWVGDYPYENCSAVDGVLAAGGGMEYPTITLIGSPSSALSLEEVIMHEVGHNWFYGILGTNERSHPWLDEGINTFYQLRYMKTKYPSLKLSDDFSLYTNWLKVRGEVFPYHSFYEYIYLLNARRNIDQPLTLHSEEYSLINYGMVYFKSALIFNQLMNYLGEETFDRAMKKYYETWKFKHPQPDDFRKIFEQETLKNLSWFFDDLLNSTKKSDYKITWYEKTTDSVKIFLKNNGKVPAPFNIAAIKDSSIVSNNWFDGFKGYKSISINIPPSEGYRGFDKLQIDPNYSMLDYNRRNNTIRAKGLFRKVEPLHLRFLTDIENPNRTQIFYCPVYGWNNYNKSMFGLAVYNSTVFQKKLEYFFMPMFATKTKNLAGSANLNYFILPQSNFFQNIRLSVNTKMYNYSDYPFALKYLKISPEITVNTRIKDYKNPGKHSIKLRRVYILKDNFRWVEDISQYKKITDTCIINELSYTFANRRKIHPHSFKFTLQQNPDFLKIQGENNMRISYSNLKKGLDIRFFIGYFITKPSENYPYDFRFRLSGQTGYQDYLFDEVFLGRSEVRGVFSQQFTETDGAFKIYTPLGQTWDWLYTLNLKSSLPGILPLKLYADFGTFKDVDKFTQNRSILYNAGICVSDINNIFEIYLPVLISDDIEKLLKLNNIDSYWQKVRFTLNLSRLNPFEFVRNFEM